VPGLVRMGFNGAGVGIGFALRLVWSEDQSSLIMEGYVLRFLWKEQQYADGV
jgi:hypothetical protein